MQQGLCNGTASVRRCACPIYRPRTAAAACGGFAAAISIDIATAAGAAAARRWRIAARRAVSRSLSAGVGS